MTKFKNKYRIESPRLKGWDYSQNGCYLITLVTAGREFFFGNVKNQKMILSVWGKIANTEWLKSFQIRKELFLKEYVIMPNHIHAIVTINKKSSESIVERHGRFIVERHGLFSVERHGRASQQLEKEKNCELDNGQTSKLKNRITSQINNDRSSQPNNSKEKINSEKIEKNILSYLKRKPKSISSFVAGFKSAVINKIDYFIDANKIKMEKFNKNNPFWQRNYYDHIIRNKTEFYKFKNYITNNPKNWNNEKDDLFK